MSRVAAVSNLNNMQSFMVDYPLLYLVLSHTVLLIALVGLLFSIRKHNKVIMGISFAVILGYFLISAYYIHTMQVHMPH